MVGKQAVTITPFFQSCFKYYGYSHQSELDLNEFINWTLWTNQLDWMCGNIIPTWRHLLLTCFNRHKATCESDHKHIFPKTASVSKVSWTESINLESKTHDNNAKCGMNNEFDGTKWFLLTNNLTLTPCGH